MKNLSRNLVVLSLGELGSRFLGFLAAAYLARKLQPEGFGIINVGLAVLGYLILAMSPGVHLYGARVVAQRTTENVGFAGEILGLRLFLSVILTVAAGCAAWIMPTSSSLIIFLYVLSLVPLSLTLDWFFQGKETMAAIGWSRIVTNFVYVIVLFIFLRSASQIVVAPIAYLIGNAAGALLLWAFFRRQVGTLSPQWRVATLFTTGGSWYGFLRHSLPIGFGTILTQAAYNLPIVLLGILGAVAGAGYYGAALRIVFFLMIVDRLATSVLLPAIARYKQEASDQLELLVGFVQKMMLVIVVPIALGGFIVAEQLIVSVYGQDFIAAIPTFRWLMVYFFFSSISTVYVCGLLGFGEEWRYSRAVLIATLVQTTMILVLTLWLGDVGAAAGYAIGEAVLFGLMLGEFRRLVRVRFVSILWRPLVAGTVMVLALSFFGDASLALMVPFGTVVFFVSLAMIGGLRKDDIAELRTRML